ncbi:MAG: hypothetical protein AAF467_07720 [Actinomycetota bacterium]
MRPPRRGAPLVVALAATLVAAVTGLTASPAAAVFDEPDVDTAADYIYVVDPDAGELRVRIELSVTADKANEPTADGFFEYYFTGYAVAVPTEAENLAVETTSGTPLVFEREIGEEFSDLLSITFARNLFFRQTTTVVIAFTLPSGRAGSENIVRINPAYASFVAWTTPFIEEATVTVELPAGFEDRSRGSDEFEPETADGALRLVANEIDPETYFTVVSLVNDDALANDVIQLPPDVIDDGEGGDSVRILSWPGDDAWRNHVTTGIDEGLPALAELVDRPWPLDDELTIIESFSPYLDGYAGWYDPETHVIEVGDEIDVQLLYHELSHVWFHHDLFTDRWITEGLAEVYAAATIEALGDVPPEPDEASPDDSDAITLAEFEYVRQPEQERWGYVASWNVMDQIVDVAGLDGLGEVIAAAEGQQMSYLGDGEPETTTTTADWRRFVDLVENLDDVDDNSVATIIEPWMGTSTNNGATQSIGAQLAERRDARARYRDLAATGGEWAPPVGVREAMTVWQFPRAEDLMADAERVLAARNEVEALIEPTAATLPADVEETYEAIERRTDDVDDALSAAADAAAEVREAHDGVVADRSPIERVGLLSVDVDAELDEATDAFSAGRFDTATDEADDVDALLAEANQRGLIRLAVAAGLLILLAGAGWFLASRLARRTPAPSLGA